MPERDSTPSMRTLEAETVVEAPIEEVFDLLVDVPRYNEFSEYLASVAVEGDGSPGTIYRLRFEWWRLSYTAVSRVEGIDRPRSIDWRVVKDVDTRGSWQLAPLDGAVDRGEPAGDRVNDTAAEGHAGGESAASEKAIGDDGPTRVTITVEYDPGSVTAGIVDLPPLVSLDRVVEKATPLIEREARTVLERLVAELEGEPRSIDLTVRHS